VTSAKVNVIICTIGGGVLISTTIPLFGRKEDFFTVTESALCNVLFPIAAN